MTRAQRLLKRIRWLKLSLFALLISGYFYIHNNPVILEPVTTRINLFLNKLIEDSLSSSDQIWHIHGLRDLLSGHPKIELITIADKKGVWLKIHQLDIDVNWLSLLKLKLDINKLAIGEIDFLRKAEKDIFSAKTSSQLSKKRGLGPVVIDQLKIGQIKLKDPIIKGGAELTMEGNLELAQGKLTTQMHIERLDGEGSANFNIIYIRKENLLSINGNLKEAPNGLINQFFAMEKRPALLLNLHSAGDLTNFTLNLDLLADSELIKGEISSQAKASGYDIRADLGGDFTLLSNQNNRSLLAPNSHLSLRGFLDNSKNFTLQNSSFSNENISLKASGLLLQDGFLRSLQLKGKIKAKDEEKIILPVNGGQFATNDLDLWLDYGAKDKSDWHAKITSSSFSFNDWQGGKLNLNFGGQLADLDKPAERYIGLNLNGEIDNLRKKSPKASQDSSYNGENISLKAQGAIEGFAPITIDHAKIASKNSYLNLRGRIKNDRFIGEIEGASANIAELTPFWPNLTKGEAKLKAKGYLALRGGGFRLTLWGEARNIITKNKSANNLLNQPIKLSGMIMRDERGLSTRLLQLENPNISLFSNGIISSNKSAITLSLALKDMALLHDKMKGPLKVKLAAYGHNRFIILAANGESAKALINNQRLSNFTFHSNIIWDKLSAKRDHFSGVIKANGKLNGENLALFADLFDSENGISVQNASLNMVGTQIAGALNISPDNFYKGDISVNLSNISPLFHLLFVPAKGHLFAKLKLDHDNKSQNIAFDSFSDNLTIKHNSLKGFKLTGSVKDLYGQLKPDLSLKIAQLQLNNASQLADPLRENELKNGQSTKAAYEASGAYGADFLNNGFFSQSLLNKTINLSNLSLQAKTGAGDISDITLNSEIANNANLSLAVELKQWPAHNNELKIKHFNLKNDQEELRLTKPALISLTPKQLTIKDIYLASDRVMLYLDAAIGDNIALKAKLFDFPLSLLNRLRPDLQLAGNLSANVNINGPSAKPNINFAIKGQNVSGANLGDKSWPKIDFSAQGHSQKGEVKAQLTVSGPAISLTSSGSIDLNRLHNDKALTIKTAVNSVPAKLLERWIPLHGLKGNISGSIDSKGSATNPVIEYHLTSDNLGLALLSAHNIDNIHAELKGALRNENLTIDKLSLQAARNLNASAKGTVNLAEKQLNLAINGLIPIEVFNQYLSKHGFRIAGPLDLIANIKGPLTDPRLFGDFTLSQGSLFETVTNINLKNINIKAALDGKMVTFSDIYGQSLNGGTVRGNGKILLDMAAGFPSQFNAYLNNYIYAYDTIVLTSINAPLYIHGPLFKNPIIEGTVTLSNTEINIPRHINMVQNLQVEHQNPSNDILRTLQRAEPKSDINSLPNDGEHNNILQLKLHILAPNHVFVRGGGVDAELGGSLNVTGPVTHLRPIGDFQLIRGRYDIGPHKVNFDSGQLSFTGKIDPDINLSGQTSANDLTVTTQVSGTISNIKLNLSSDPPLPQDEILAHLLFNSSLSQLTPFQVTQVALTAAELIGLRRPVIDSLRNRIGLDDIDLITDDKGNVALKFGRYIKQNLYLGLKAGTKDQSQLDLNYNITKSLKAKASLNIDGQSNIGIFYEKDF